MKIPLNRFVAFVKPYINLAAGAAAAWLVAKVNLLGLPGLDEANTATWIAGAVTWALSTGGAQLGDLKWLKGHHVVLEGDAQVQAAAILNQSRPLEPAITVGVVGQDLEPGEDELDNELPSDEEEFANPPAVDPPVVQPSQSGVVEP